MNHESVDFSQFDPARDRLAWERLVRAVMNEAAPELARRQAAGGVVGLLTSWTRPLLAAAATVTLLAGGALVAAAFRSEASGTTGGSLEDAFSLVEPVSRWLSEDRGPTSGDVVLAMSSDLP